MVLKGNGSGGKLCLDFGFGEGAELLIVAMDENLHTYGGRRFADAS